MASQKIIAEALKLYKKLDAQKQKLFQPMDIQLFMGNIF